MPDELRWFWQAFWELDTCRGYVDGVPLRIPWTAALEYARYHQIDFDYIWHLIVVLDGKYVAFRTKKHNEEIDKMKKEAGRAKQRGRKHGRR